MGKHKAGVRWQDGATLGELAEQALLTVSDVVVILGHGEGLSPRGGRLRIEDAEPGGGPLQAIATLVGSGLGERFIVMPCDMPGLDAASLQTLIAASTADSASAFINGQGRPQPLPVCLPSAMHPQLVALVASGERRLGALHAALDFVHVPIPGDEHATLRNVNRPEDLQAPKSQRKSPSKTSVMALSVPVVRHGPVSGTGSDSVSVETPLQILLGQAPIAVLMRTPGHDEELVTGFFLSEGIVAAASDLASVKPCDDVDLPAAKGNVIRAELAPGVKVDVARIARNTYVGSSCGICGQASIERALAIAGPVPHQPSVSAEVLVALPERLRARQATFALTGGLHAAALFDEAGALVVVREDVGRHNAVDKVLGHAAQRGLAAGELGLFVSGRISFEIVQKAMASEVGLVAGVSAPTSLAIELAGQGNVALYGFVRGGRATRY